MGYLEATAIAKADPCGLTTKKDRQRQKLPGFARRRARVSTLKGGEDDGYYDGTEEEAAAVGDCVDDGVFVELAAGGEEPEAADPEEQDGDEEPEATGVLVELCGVEVGDVKREDDYGGVAAGGAEGAELLDVGDMVAAASGGVAATFAEIFELGEAFDEGEREEEEDAEAAEPDRGRDSSGGGSGDDADGVEAGENDDVDQNHALEAERISERSSEIDAEPEQEM